MNNFNRLNNLVGWAVFLISSLTYILTIEPTASWWDCPEFIASAYKLEPGHPPGAPLFLLIGNFFSLFAFGDVTKVALMVNIMSALASAFAVLFLFWTITHLARKIVSHYNDESDVSLSRNIVILGSGVVGALAYNFSDTAWFSAVEGEVYAMSSFFTAIVFWAIMKWENVADEKYSNRWIILIAYLMGLSIGVHLLNLLTIPAIVLVYYFKKYKPTSKGLFLAFITSIGILAFVQYGIVQGFVSLAAKFDLLFVNSFGLPYFSGVAFFIICLFAGLGWGIYHTYKHKMYVLNTFFTALTVVIIGYSSYATIVIRSSANTPMNENAPNNMFSLLSYLDREQYGDRPLVYGPYYNAPLDSLNPYTARYTYIAHHNKYKKIETSSPIYNYDSRFKTIFPRMYSHTDNHSIGYKSWANIATPDNQPPSFFDNISFFLNYQVGFMYFRYFMWNFAGRQNDLQGYGGLSKGNWISGFGDAIRIGSQDNLPKSWASNKGMNKYYFIPLLLGLFGMFFNFIFHQRSFWIVMLLFFFTGLAIILYLNQTPFQPRERDYAYAGSFYVFCIWIGFGVISLYNFFRKYMSKLSGGILACSLSCVAPVIMSFQNWDDHDRSGRYTVPDFAYNYLNSCEKNAILFTYGDNDTFPLWYAQEVEGVRTDVRIINLSLLGGDWYIEQMKHKTYDSDPVPFSLTYDQFVQGVRDAVPLINQGNYLLDERYFANKSKFEPAYKKLYEAFIDGLKKTKFPELKKEDFDVLVKGHQAITPLTYFILINRLTQKENLTKFEIKDDYIKKIKSVSDSLLNQIGNAPVLISDAIKFVASDDVENKVGEGKDETNFFPSKKFIIPVDVQKVLKNGTVPADKASMVLPELDWTINRNYIMKNDLMVMDLIANNNWERPIYFATSVGAENYLGLDDYLQLDGFVYRLVPYKAQKEKGQTGSVNADKLYDNLINKFKWGRMNEKDFLMENNNQRVISIIGLREIFNRCADGLLEKNDKARAIKVLDKCIELMPHEKIPFDYNLLPIIENYYIAEAFDKGNAVVKVMIDDCSEQLAYINSLNNSMQSSYDRERQTAGSILNELIKLTKKYKQTELNQLAQNKMDMLWGKVNNEVK